MKEQINKILLVDDDITTNLYHKIILEDAAFAKEIITAENGKEALEHLRKNEDKPDVVLLDLNMPIMNGWEFLESLTKMPKETIDKMKVIVVSASKNPDDKEKASKYDNVTGFLIKPIKISDLNPYVG